MQFHWWQSEKVLSISIELSFRVTFAKTISTNIHNGKTAQINKCVLKKKCKYELVMNSSPNKHKINKLKRNTKLKIQFDVEQ